MVDVLKQVHDWLAEGEKAAIAIVVGTWGSSPRIPGSKMGISETGKIVGSVSGGCVEGAVAAEAMGVINKGEAKLIHYGVTDETAWEVGLACGGKLDVLIIPAVQTDIKQVLDSVENGNEFHWKHKYPTEDSPYRYEVGPGDPTANSDWDFVDRLLPQSKLILIGAGHISVVLAGLAKAIGYQVIVIDPRRAFSTKDRFPEADIIFSDFPSENILEEHINTNTAIAVLSHDPKIDDPGLIPALRSKAFYIGALGSRKTQAARRERLLKAGFTDGDLERIRGPIGLNLGGRKPEEIAVSILAEIIQVRNA